MEELNCKVLFKIRSSYSSKITADESIITIGLDHYVLRAASSKYRENRMRTTTYMRSLLFVFERFKKYLGEDRKCTTLQMFDELQIPTLSNFENEERV